MNTHTHATLVLDQVHTYYDDAHVLRGMSLHVAEGEAVSLLGRNGAGKTTTINTIVGFAPPRHGEILFKNRSIAQEAPHVIANMGMGLVPQGRRLFTNLTVRENIMLGARSPQADNGRRAAWTYERVVALFPRIAERERNRADQLSGGEQQMVAIARALMTNPTLLLLDEPSEGLAPLLVREVGDVLVRLKEEGLSILLVEQNFALATRVADRVYVLNRGAVVFEGKPDELQANEAIKKEFLGV